MERRSRFVTFLVSLFPGVGYMYFGMLRKGIETISIFLLVPFVLRAVWLGSLAWIFTVPFWLYTFFDTYNIARRFDRGEIINDESWFVKDGDNVRFNISNMDHKVWTIAAWVLIVLGILSVISRVLYYFDMFYIVSSYFVPVLFVLVGIYILIRRKKIKIDGVIVLMQ